VLERGGLLLVDFICYYNPPVAYLRKYLDDHVDMALHDIHDIGFVCVLSYENYGSAFTNMAMYHVLKDMGKSVLMITQPLCSEIKPASGSNFITTPWSEYEIAPSYQTQQEMTALNRRCGMFLVGSDQMFNYEIYKRVDGFIKLDWVDDEHRKICYATSFGQDRLFGTLEESRKFKKSLSRFDAVSVREQSGVGIFAEKFHLKAEQVLDPVFLCEESHYRELCKEIAVPAHYVFAYILDPDEDKAGILKDVSGKEDKELVVMADKWMNQEYLSKIWDMKTMAAQKNEVWLAYMMNSDFVVTDSFHGVCFSIIFRKQFVAINNKKRGTARFVSLLRMLGLLDRLFDGGEDLRKALPGLSEIDYGKVDAVLAAEKRKGMEWLRKNLDGGSSGSKESSRNNLTV